MLALLALTSQACGPSAPVDAPSGSHSGSHSGSQARASSPLTWTVPAELPQHVREAVGAADRSEADRALDAGRRPAELLAFAGVTRGAKVAELMAGGGYTAELLARAVGPTGKVYGQNSSFVLERFAAKPWAERLDKPVMKGVVRVDRELSDPLPPEATGLDAVFLVLFYHDTVWQKLDRPALNAAVFKALRPGGVYVVVDHAGRPGTGTSETETLHRIEEGVVRREIQAAGFRLEAEATFLRNPSDTRDWNASPSKAGEKRGTSDRFVLKFVKP
jgi:predicted methyltransferase